MTDHGSSNNMGDLFNRRRQARRENQDSFDRDHASRGSGPRSFLEIQAEQERAQRYASERRSPRGDDYGRMGDYGKRSGDYGNRGSDSGRRGGDYGRRRNDRRGPDRSNMPKEMGLIASLKDSFGFIYCADRPEEIFFHYSEVKNCHPGDLEMDMEVEFLVGPARNDDKSAAYSVRVIEPGTIVWETEDRPGERVKGLVDRPLRTERGSSQVAEGTIKLVVESSSEAGAEDDDQIVTVTETGGPVVSFTANDYTRSDSKGLNRSDSTSSSSSRTGGRLCRGDLVEFKLVTERRTGRKAARSITLVQSERERQRLKREKELLANATLEKGVVTTLKSDFGFLRSDKRREEVYFHFSHVKNEKGDVQLKEGQDLQFLVVTEPGGSGRKDKLSARKVEFLPRGSVIFETQVAEGVTGVVSRCPHCVDSTYDDELVGKIRLNKAIVVKSDDGTESTVREVNFKASDAPGGSYSANRDGSSVGLWVREGDTLLFDLVKELIDESYTASPTKLLRPKVEGKDVLESAKKGIRIVSLSLAGRAEGVVHALKDIYGFISCAERPVDAYFRTYELLPEVIQADLRRNMDLPDHDTNKSIPLTVDAEVQFDLSLQGKVPMTGGRNRRSGEKESLKAQRVLVLPPSSIVQTQTLAKDLKGVVDKQDPKQPYAGMLELEEEVKTMSLEELHPLVAKLVKSMLEDNDSPPESVVFPDLQALKEDHVVVRMVESLSNGKLQCMHDPVAGGGEDHPGRLTIRRVDVEPPNSEEIEKEVNVEGISTPEKQVSHIEPANDEENTDHATSSTSKSKKKKKKTLKVKSAKLVRYDKHSLAKEIQNGMPLEKDDVVVCDVVQSRRSGMVSLRNLRVVERKMIDRGVSMESSEQASGVGIVTEVVSSRQFGFISVLDENATKREQLFFHTSSVVTDESIDITSPTKSRVATNQVRKGDEVKFDIGIGKNGKRVATAIHVVPRGTLNIPMSASKNACHGYVLMEPSHTSLENTPARQSGSGHGKSGGSGTGRWDSVGKEGVTRSPSGSLVKEEGSILLLTDPAGLFGGEVATKNTKNDKNGSASTEPEASKQNSTLDEKIASSEGADPPTTEPSASCILTHLHYKNGALALHGHGASSSADTSSGPRRGDLVSFVKARSGKGVRDIRLITRGAATVVRGRLENIRLIDSNGVESSSFGTARFVAATAKEEVYEIDLNEIVSCDAGVLKENESVEGIVHEGEIYGICRTTDLYLGSKLGGNHKERPRLNLTVRKELKNLGGKIMAQSMMAKGPDGTNGFAPGWTKRVSKFVTEPTKDDVIAGGVPSEAEAPPDQEQRKGEEQS